MDKAEINNMDKAEINNMDKAEIILELVKSLNMGNCSYADRRVLIAEMQYEQLEKAGYIVDGKLVTDNKGDM